MSPFPTQLVDRWSNRAEPAPEQGKLYWHALFEQNPQVREIAQAAQAKLARFTGLHMTPPQRLHMTILVAGPTETITTDQTLAMVDKASKRLADVPPITVTLGRLLYHPEAIMLGVRPEDDLEPLRDAVQRATRAVIGTDGGVTGGNSGAWIPHVTLCYSTAEQPAEPIIEALGTELPPCEVTIGAVNLVLQKGAERLWDWHPVGTAKLLG